MITLVLFMCHAVHTTVCEKDAVPWEYSLQECMLYGQHYFAQEIQARRPNQRLVRYKCVIEPVEGNHA